jgi:hypothetical protein
MAPSLPPGAMSLGGGTQASAFLRNVGFIRGDAEGGQGPGGVAGVVAQRGGEVDRLCRPAEGADDEVAQASHDLRAGPGPDLGGVLGEGHVADVVQAVLDRPMLTQQAGEPGRPSRPAVGC